MRLDPGLEIGQVLDNNQLMEIFKVANQGGMRKSNTTNSLLIISDSTKEIYSDKWEGDTFHYTGMGLEGDQSLDYKQNKTLVESNDTDINLFLFEVFEPNKYIYKGRVKLAAEPYQEAQPDESGADRNVWMFPLKITEFIPNIVVMNFSPDNIDFCINNTIQGVSERNYSAISVVEKLNVGDICIIRQTSDSGKYRYGVIGIWFFSHNEDMTGKVEPNWIDQTGWRYKVHMKPLVQRFNDLFEEDFSIPIPDQPKQKESLKVKGLVQNHLQGAVSSFVDQNLAMRYLKNIIEDKKNECNIDADYKNFKNEIAKINVYDFLNNITKDIEGEFESKPLPDSQLIIPFDKLKKTIEFTEEQKQRIKEYYENFYYGVFELSWPTHLANSKMEFDGLFYNNANILLKEEKFDFTLNDISKLLKCILDLSGNQGINYLRGKIDKNENIIELEEFNKIIYQLYKRKDSIPLFLANLMKLRNRITGFGDHTSTQLGCYIEPNKYPLITNEQANVLYNIFQLPNINEDFDNLVKNMDFLKKNRDLLYKIVLFIKLKEYIQNSLAKNQSYDFFELNKFLWKIHATKDNFIKIYGDISEKLLMQWKIVLLKYKSLGEKDRIHFDFDMEYERIIDVREKVNEFLLKDNETDLESAFKEFWKQDKIYSAIRGASANLILDANKLSTLKEIFDEMVNLEEYQDEWHKKVKYAKNSLWELFGILHDNIPAINNCTKSSLELLLNKTIIKDDYSTILKQYEKFEEFYEKLVGHVIENQEILKGIKGTIHIEIDKLFNVLDKARESDLNEIKDKDVINLFEIALSLRKEEPGEDIIEEPLDVNEMEKEAITHLIAGKNLIFYGPPGTGKTRAAKKVADYFCSQANYSFLTANAEWTTYDVIGGPIFTENNQLKFKPGFFSSAIKKCRNKILEQVDEVSQPYWLIIDEINRANLDLAFGKIFTLLDIDYRNESILDESELEGLIDSEEYKNLQISPEFRVLATMNTYDKAILFSLGYAFRRRFAFIEIDSPFKEGNDSVYNFKSPIWEDTLKDITENQYEIFEKEITSWKEKKSFLQIPGFDDIAKLIDNIKDDIKDYVYRFAYKISYDLTSKEIIDVGFAQPIDLIKYVLIYLALFPEKIPLISITNPIDAAVKAYIIPHVEYYLAKARRLITLGDIEEGEKVEEKLKEFELLFKSLSLFKSGTMMNRIINRLKQGETKIF